MIQQFSNDQIHIFKNILFLDIYTEETLWQAAFSRNYFFNNTFINCSAPQDNFIKLLSSFLTDFEYINFRNGKSGFLVADNSNISISNSTFDNSHLNFSNELSFIRFNHQNFQNYFKIFKCLFNGITSLDSGGVITIHKKNLFIFFYFRWFPFFELK